MTPERKEEIRFELQGCACGSCSASWQQSPPYHVRLARELLAEVDRLEMVANKIRGIAEGLRHAHRQDDERRRELIAQEQRGELPPIWDVHEKLIRVCRMDLAKTTADALDEAIARLLDSPPAKR